MSEILAEWPSTIFTLPLHHNPRNLGLICLAKKRKIRVRIPSDLKKRMVSFQLFLCIMKITSSQEDQQFCSLNFSDVM